jgi:hypothetical protein
LNVRRVAALPSSQNLTGTPCEDEPAVLKGRRGGTDEFLGRGMLVPQSPWSSGQGGRPLDKCLVQLHADAVARKSHAAVSEAVKSSPVVTPRKKKKSSPVRGASIDRRGHIRVRPAPPGGSAHPVGPGRLGPRPCSVAHSDRGSHFPSPARRRLNFLLVCARRKPNSQPLRPAQVSPTTLAPGANHPITQLRRNSLQPLG